MDVTQDLIISTILQSSAQCAGVLQVLEGDSPISGKPKVEEHEVLSDDGGSRTTEVERERKFNGTEIMDFENEIFWEEMLGTPDDPTDTNLGQTKFMSGRIDGHNSGNLEIPY